MSVEQGCPGDYTLLGRSHSVPEPGVELNAVGGLLCQVGCGNDGSFGENGDNHRPAEAEKTFFISAPDNGLRIDGIYNRSDIGGTDFEEKIISDGGIGHHGNPALVLPDAGEAAGEGNRVDGVESSIDEAGRAAFSGEGKVKPVVVGGAQSRKNGGAILEAGGESGVAEQLSEIEALPFGVDGLSFRKVGHEEVAAVGGKDDRVLRIGKRAGGGFEATGL